MNGYNGHKNWNHWNVSLWINNTEDLYRQAQFCIQITSTKDNAARAFKKWLGEQGITRTSDGAPYSLSSIRAAFVGI